MDEHRLVLDNRYRDLSGIGRYAREVVSRLTVPWRPLSSAADPMGKMDVLNRARLRLRTNDVLYSPGFAVGPTRALQIPTLHDLLHITHPREDAGRLHGLYYTRVVRPAVRRSKHVITVSGTSAKNIRAWIDDDSVSVHDCGNGCSDAFSAEGPVFEARRPYFLFVGNTKPHKRLHLAMQALRAVPDADLRVVVKDVEGATKLARALGVAERVHLHSDVSDEVLATLYRGSLALLFTSEWEGFGLPVIESIRCGAPVVCDAACESAAELASQDPASVVLPEGSSVSDWADVTLAMFETRTRAVAAASWLDSYTWSAVAARVDAVLTDAT